MALYIRYLSTDPADITLQTLAEALGTADPSYAIAAAGNRRRVMRGEESLGEIEIAHAAQPLFSEEIEDLKAALADLDELAARPVRQLFQQTRAMVVVRVLWERRDTEETLAGLKPLWDWLLAHRAGLLQIDEEGYFGPQGRVLEVK